MVKFCLPLSLSQASKLKTPEYEMNTLYHHHHDYVVAFTYSSSSFFF